MKLINLIAIICLLFFASSCTIRQYVKKDTHVYTYEANGIFDSIREYVTTTKVDVKVSEMTNDNYVRISVDQPNMKYFEKVNTSHQPNFGDWRNWETRYHFSYDYNYSEKNPFKYYENKLVIQSIAVPMKIRFGIDENKYIDSFPLTTETSASLSIAFGYKQTCSKYSQAKNYQGSNFNRTSFTIGPFIGLSVADLNTNTTRPKITFVRKAPAINYGIFGVYGFNNINLGLSIGVDYATGVNHNLWIYQGKGWCGIVVGFDILK